MFSVPQYQFIVQFYMESIHQNQSTTWRMTLKMLFNIRPHNMFTIGETFFFCEYMKYLAAVNLLFILFYVMPAYIEYSSVLA